MRAILARLSNIHKAGPGHNAPDFWWNSISVIHADTIPTMPQQSLALSAPADRALQLWFEPWAEGLTVPAGATVELHANSRVPGQLTVEEAAGRTVVLGWGGCTLRALLGGKIVLSFDQPAPDFLDRASFDLLFAPPPGRANASSAPAAPQPAAPPRRSWWRLWAR
jgi:hypothetical protein